MDTEITLDDIKRVIFELAQSQKETEAILKKNSIETDKKIKELGKQIGGIGERFGYFTEGLAINSMEKILQRDFKSDHITPRAKVYDKEGNVRAEYDVLAYCNSDTNIVVVVEVKSTLRPQHITDFEKTLKEFNSLNPELANKKLHGILAFIGNFDKNLQEHCHSKGIYTATIHNEIFKLSNPKTPFMPKNFNID